ncbi:MAG: TolC family protein [Saprospiraceae bacterium]|nr:TolC family protein [Saprospiraceae bacterium]MCF8251901.1 TolC family protein [Saprospiraceae bacterium]MCF8281606.1 TolC family protein [Bacteroidales bacterium]MCF8313583.1 TolC family protein [Saprospiraceae bacterium]MCF8442285.1 TolC family protein [Saprospiraceae bacterium]
MAFYRNIYALVLVGLCQMGTAQTILTEQQAIEMALKTHPAMEATSQYIRQQEVLKNAGTMWEHSQFFHSVTADPDLGLFGTTNLGIQQNFPSGKTTRANRGLHASLQRQAEARQGLTRQEVVKQVREIYHHLSYLDGKSALYSHLDSVYQRVAKAADARYRTGDVSLAEKLAAQDKAAQIRLDARTVYHEIEFDRIVLGQILGLGEAVQPVVERLHEGVFSIADTTLLQTSTMAKYSKSAIEVARSEQELTKAKFAPTASAGVFGQYLGNGDIYPGWQLGLNVPLFKKSLRAQSEAAEIGIEAANAAFRTALLAQQNELGHLLHEQEKYLILLEYYNADGKVLAAELLRTGELNYSQGELSYADFVQLLEQAAGIEVQHLENLLGLNQTIIELEALTGQ